MKLVLLTATLITVVLVNCRVKAKPQNETKASSRTLWKGAQIILEWHFVGNGDYFVRPDERMSWDFAQEFCNKIGLQLYEPRNTINVARYLEKHFKSNASEPFSYIYFIGGRGNGHNMCWLSGEVVANNELLIPSDRKNVGTDDCLFLDTHPSVINGGAALRTAAGLCYRIDWAPRALCGESRAYTLDWHSVGGERFARYNHVMDWEDSRALCKQFGLDLFQPKNVLMVAAYLNNLKSGSSDPNTIHCTEYWLGGNRVPSMNMCWLDGRDIPFSSPLWARDPTSYPRPKACIATYTYFNGEKAILADGCNVKYRYPLCGYTKFSLGN